VVRRDGTIQDLAAVIRLQAEVPDTRPVAEVVIRGEALAEVADLIQEARDLRAVRLREADVNWRG
jgi:hypothetical protein